MGVVSDLLDVHPETIRVWERNGLLLPPHRKSGKRLFSEIDLKRLQFVLSLRDEGLNIPAIRHYLRLYPCWLIDNCDGPTHSSGKNDFRKPCWRKAGSHCQASGSENPCSRCKSRCQQESSERQVLNQPT
ncbi:MerR family transcriptional regulator [Chloroflexota bacterium]